MSAQNESKGPAILFLGTCWVLSEHTGDGSIAFVMAGLLMLVGWLSLRFMGKAVFRLGLRGWSLLAQLAIAFGLFLWLAPYDLDIRIALVWGLGLPCMLLGAACQKLAEWSPRFRRFVTDRKFYIIGGVYLLLVGAAWFQGGGLWHALFAPIIALALLAVPFAYGMQLAEAPPAGERDARFGSRDDYRNAGMSDDR